MGSSASRHPIAKRPATSSFFQRGAVGYRNRLRRYCVNEHEHDEPELDRQEMGPHTISLDRYAFADDGDASPDIWVTFSRPFPDNLPGLVERDRPGAGLGRSS